MTNKTINLDHAAAERIAATIDQGALFYPEDLEALRAALANPVPPAGGVRVGLADLMREAQTIVESKCIWKRFIDGTPLSNDISVWMAEFARDHVELLQAELANALEELDTLKDAVHHALDDSEEDAQTGQVTLYRTDFDKLIDLVPEEWHEQHHNQSAPADKGRGDLQGGWVTISKDVKSFLPAGVDRVSMMGVTIHGNGSQNPVTQTMNGVIVNLDGYTLYAPGAKHAPALIETLRANGDRIAMEATIAQQAQRIADLEAGKGQVEPVAWMYRREGGECLGQLVQMESDNLKDVREGKVVEGLRILWPREDYIDWKPLYAEQPAPVAVVLPERMDPLKLNKEYWYCVGWNACLDEIAHLNPIKQ
ncbi:hypothetical protein PHLH3_08220 [Pseudomonas sp. St386]|uniref:hypothetical protein n=1 Tax=Pseudomonas sp. St386 TaxID=2678256 RepID=UPI001BB36D98|nr:hypothetical protein [Pseudomonas sp. St386]BBP51196.1 hypothetical protein PHLH3_08220 [Pseudomonas sp. St386]